MGRPISVRALSDREFYVDGGDHTRVAFIDDGSGKITGAILNPGAREIKGVEDRLAAFHPLLPDSADLAASRHAVARQPLDPRGTCSEHH